MPSTREPDPARRSVVPDAAGRSLWPAAAWTGIGAAVVCATAAIVAVAVCWLPVAGASGHTGSTVRAGLLTFLAALHGGITVDGSTAQFLPLGLSLLVGLAAWRAGSGLGDVAAALGERDPVRLAVAGAAQTASFAVTCLVAVPFARLGTSSAPFLGVAGAAVVLFAVTGGAAFVRATALGTALRDRLPTGLGRGSRAAAAALLVYLGAGSVLVAGSLVDHAGRVEALSRSVGGGWGGVPVLLIGVLSAPNAVIAAIAYLAGPGFAVGVGSTVSPFGAAHGLVPAVPLLGALPTGAGAPLGWGLLAVTALTGAGCVLTVVWSAGSWRGRARDAALAAAVLGAGITVLAWQGGGGVGAGRLRAVGASPWRTGLSVTVEIAALAGTALAAAAAAGWLRARAARWRRQPDLAATGHPGPRHRPAAEATGDAPEPVNAEPVNAEPVNAEPVNATHARRRGLTVVRGGDAEDAEADPLAG